MKKNNDNNFIDLEDSDKNKNKLGPTAHSSGDLLGHARGETDVYGEDILVVDVVLASVGKDDDILVLDLGEVVDSRFKKEEFADKINYKI